MKATILDLTTQTITYYRNEDGVVVHAEFVDKQTETRYCDESGHALDLDVISQLEELLRNNG